MLSPALPKWESKTAVWFNEKKELNYMYMCAAKRSPRSRYCPIKWRTGPASVISIEF